MNSTIKKHLARDPVMEKLISQFPLPELPKTPNLFFALIESVVSQQLSVKASDTIMKRFLGLFGDQIPEPGQIAAIPDDTIRAVGISYSKIKYIKGIEAAVLAGELDLNALHDMADEDVIAELIKLKGIGQWTAEMQLIFSLRRPDVFSMGDIGLRNAVSKLYGVYRDSLHEIESISLQWKPYRSYASRLLWKSLDNTPK